MNTEPTLQRDEEAEAATIGAIIQDAKQIEAVQGIITPQSFYNQKNVATYAAMLRLYRANGPTFDIVQIRSELDKGGKLQDVGGTEALLALADAVPDPTNAPYYAGRVRECANQRQLTDATERLRYAMSNGGINSNIIADLESAIGNIKAERVADLAPMQALKLCDDYPELRRIIIEGLLRETETLNLIASAKVGKTYLALGMALCVATGRRWLGRQVAQGRVLYIDCELHPDTLAKRLAAVATAMGICGVEFADTLDVLSLRGRLQDIFQLGAFFRSIPRGKYAVIVLDALYRLIPAGIDENSNADMTRIYNAIDQHGEAAGSAFVVVHHASKGNQSQKSTTDVGSGAGAISRAADSHLILRPHEEDDAVVLESVARSFPPSPATCLRWTYPTWSVADDLDPEKLRVENRRKPKAEAAPGWTPARFATEFISDEPTEMKLVIAKARQAGLKKSDADGLLRLAEGEGRAKFIPRVKATDPQLVIRNTR